MSSSMVWKPHSADLVEVGDIFCSNHFSPVNHDMVGDIGRLAGVKASAVFVPFFFNLEINFKKLIVLTLNLRWN